MFAHETTHLGTAFKQYFEVVPAVTEELRQEAYRIRHSVYCEDLQFESQQANGLEIDEYDDYSLHLLIRSVSSGLFIGCTRIIRPLPEDDNKGLPFEKTCAQILERSVIDPSKLPRDKIAEISRLAVISAYRRRKGEKNSAISISEQDFGNEPTTRFPYIPLGLYCGTVELARIYNIEVLFMLIEGRLANHFNKLGGNLEFIGAPVEHHGQRFPSMILVSHVFNNLKPIIRPLYQAIAEDIKTGLEGKNQQSIDTHSD